MKNSFGICRFFSTFPKNSQAYTFYIVNLSIGNLQYCCEYCNFKHKGPGANKYL